MNFEIKIFLIINIKKRFDSSIFDFTFFPEHNMYSKEVDKIIRFRHMNKI